MVGLMEIERPVKELEGKIAELKNLAETEKIDLSDQISTLEERAEKLKKRLYKNLTPWQKTQMARHPMRPYTLDYAQALFDEYIELHGDRCYGDDKSIVGGFAKLDGRPVIFIGHQKGRNTRENIERNFGSAHPEGYRKAMRLMEQAERFKRPILTFIDTQGAFCGIGAEERGQSEAIASSLCFMSRLKTPIIAVIIGEGGSGGAIGLGVGNRILMLENSVYSVISPEGCAAILWKDAGRAREAAEILKLTASDLKQLGVIDEIIPEPIGGAHNDYEKTIAAVKRAIKRHLSELSVMSAEELVANRYDKFKRMGVVGSIMP